MADLTVTATGVVPADANTVIARGTAGANITAGQPVYLDATNKIQPAANTSAVTAAVVGIAVNAASNGQPIEYVVSGNLTLPVTGNLTLATVYVMGNLAGAISPSVDLDNSTNTRFGTVLGIATSATNLLVGILASGVKNP